MKGRPRTGTYLSQSPFIFVLYYGGNWKIGCWVLGCCGPCLFLDQKSDQHLGDFFRYVFRRLVLKRQYFLDEEPFPLASTHLWTPHSVLLAFLVCCSTLMIPKECVESWNLLKVAQTDIQLRVQLTERAIFNVMDVTSPLAENFP